MALSSEESTQKDELSPIESQKEIPFGEPQGPFGILNKYRTQLKRLRHGEPSSTLAVEDCQESPAASIMKTATLIKRLQSHNRQKTTGNNLSEFQYDLADQKDKKYLKLALCLLDAVESFSNQKYDEALKFLRPILRASGTADHPVERVVKYFANYLRERIDEENGKLDLEREVVDVDVLEALMDMKATIQESEQKASFNQITHFTTIQTILDTVPAAERIHLIDMGINVVSSHWIVMMHALANNQKTNPIKQLKITGVYGYKEEMEKTAEFLSSSTDSMGLPFVFKTLDSEIDQITKDEFEIETNETVVVYMQFCLTSLSAYPEKIEALIGKIKTLKPCMMLVREMEANTSASAFIDRFHEALYICSALFDSYEGCIGRRNWYRKISERLYFQEMIRNRLLAPDDDQNFNRCVNLKFWREYFARFGIVEMELSQASVCQARLLAKEFDRHCTIGMNGKSMILGCNETLLYSLSAWKFQHQ